jgi:hypothetical protein
MTERIRVSPAVHPVGTRLIVVADFPLSIEQQMHQVTVVEWAPSGRFVGLRMNETAKIGWHAVEAFNVIEVLAPTPAAKTAAKRDAKARVKPRK